MELPLKVYSPIARHIERRADLCTLCLVSKGFRAATERELYRSLDVSEPSATILLCNLLSCNNGTNPRAHDLFFLPSDYWTSVSRALQRTTHLRSLRVHVSRGTPLKCAWILGNCSFRLHTFHCDFSWDAHLVSFLSTQHLLSELHISDFNEDIPETVSVNAGSLRQPRTIPNLSILDCTFTGAVGTFVPGRPVTHVKTCFSSSSIEAKRVELALLLANLRLSTQPLHSLILADESYNTAFSLELLSSLVKAFGPIPRLKFVGPLVLPVDGRERLKLYGHLAHLRELRGAELDISQWEPPLASFLGLRALARELHLYAPSSFYPRPTVLRAVGGIWSAGDDITADTIWRTV
ncbi:hypothetical protein H4582DRAFT_2112056 [Lactarius indigo]|nr:hypothetical protein H4582DRAFT_2112056 [Lactarius indigo]